MFTQQKTHTKHPTWPHFHTYTTHHEVVFTVWTCVRTIIIIIMILELILHTGLSLCFPYKQIRFSILSHFLYAGWYVTWQYGVFFPFLKAQFLCNLWLMEPRLCVRVCVCVFNIQNHASVHAPLERSVSLTDWWKAGRVSPARSSFSPYLYHTHTCTHTLLLLQVTLSRRFIASAVSHTHTHTVVLPLGRCSEETGLMMHVTK